MSEPDLWDVFARLVGGQGHRRETAEIQRALILLEDKIDLLAGFEGQTLPELRETFQLLPLGTRMALQQAGAIVQRDKGDKHFHVEVLPFAQDLVAAAVVAQYEAEASESRPAMKAELRRIWNERFEVGAPDRKVKVSDPALQSSVDVIGTFEAKGEFQGVDEGQNKFSLLVKDGSSTLASVRSSDLPEGRVLAVGQHVCLSFAVGVPKEKRMRWSRTVTGEERGRIMDAARSKPGFLLVHYSRIPDSDKGLVSFPHDESQPNAVAELRSIVAVD